MGFLFWVMNLGFAGGAGAVAFDPEETTGVLLYEPTIYGVLEYEDTVRGQLEYEDTIYGTLIDGE